MVINTPVHLHAVRFSRITSGEYDGRDNRPAQPLRGETNVKNIHRFAMVGVSLTALVAPHQAFAQTAGPAAAASANEADKEIIVTGTLIRGTQVTGSQTLTIDSEAISAKLATSTNELLGTIPQIVNSFNGRIENDPRGFTSGSNSINRPNLRSIPSVNTTSGGLTLVLVDGMRPAPVGINQASPDVDIIPAAVLEGIDVVTDGGSSLYGADAVAGVINFRTLRKFDGIKIDGNSSHGTTIKGYKAWDAALTAGTSWSTGNAYISGGYSNRDLIRNGDTTWSNGLVYNAAGVSSVTFTQCPNAVGTETRWFRFGPGAAQFTNNPLAPGAGTFPIGAPCDQTAALTYFPKQTRSNVYAALSQEFGENVDLRVTAYFTKRDTEFSSFPRGFTAAGSPLTTGALVGAAFPGAAVGSVTAVPGGTSFSFGPNPAYQNPPSKIGFETWGITPQLTFRLGSNWQVRTNAHFGRSTNSQSFPGVDTVKAQAYITGGQLNPRNAAAASAAVIQDITNYESAQQTKHQLVTLRAIADGSLFTLPAGDVKVAVGAEFQENKAESRLNAGPVGSLGAVPFLKSTRNAKSVFAEVSVPVTSFLDLSGSVRHDNYSDFGSTTNPNIGFALKPTDWLKIFGHWNTSFNAPTAIDNLNIGTGRFVCGIYVNGSTNPAQRPNDPLGRDTSKQGTCAMVLQGSSPGLKPQTAKSWAVGFEAKPGSVFRFGGQYYSIDLKNALGTLDPSVTSTYTTNANLYTYNLTPAQYTAVLATLTNGTSLGAQQPSSNIAIIVDTRISNLNAAKLEGFDFNASLTFKNDNGQTAIGISGTRQTRAFITNGGVSSNRLGVGSPRLLASTYLDIRHGPVSGKLTINYSGRFLDNANNNLGEPEHANPFVTTNLGLGYDFKEANGPLSGFSLRLNVDNLFEVLPQSVRRVNTNNPSYVNWTLGRVIKLGGSFKF
jgi:iron complex outermembrane recepter protein